MIQRDLSSDQSDFGCLSFKELRTLVIVLIFFYLIFHQKRSYELNFMDKEAQGRGVVVCLSKVNMLGLECWSTHFHPLWF